MQMPVNPFRQALKDGRAQIGLWVALTDANVAEALAGCGFDWLLLDGEHAPNDLRQILQQLRAIAPYPAHPVARLPHGDTALIKQYLDIGAQTLLIPMVDTPEQAATLARAMRYPPRGVRGMGAGLARASRWNQVADYLDRADDEVCLLVQAETTEAMGHLDAIARTDGVDGVFFGPVDLSASMGFRGQPGHPEVQRAILEGIATVRAAGKAAGILTSDRQLARRYLEAGALFVAVGSDSALLVRSATELAAAFKGGTPPPGAVPGAAY